MVLYSALGQGGVVVVACCLSVQVLSVLITTHSQQCAGLGCNITELLGAGVEYGGASAVMRGAVYRYGSIM